MPVDQDNIWKDIIQRHLYDFLTFFWPRAAEDIDWSKPPEFLDKELTKIHSRAQTGRRTVDKLVKVFLKADKTVSKKEEELWLPIHVEIQSGRDSDFAYRIYEYNTLIERYYQKRNVQSLAILTDSNKKFRPTKYRREQWGNRKLVEFKMVKLLDYADKWDELEQNPNPFAIVVLAYLKVLELNSNNSPAEELYSWKVYLIRMLYQRHYNRKQIIDYFWFLDWLIMLPEALEARFEEEIRKLEGETEMPYVSNFERRATARGEAQGLQRGLTEGRLEITLRLLNRKVGPLEPEVEEQVRGLNGDQLLALSDALLDFTDKAALLVWLQANAKAAVLS